MSLVPTVRCRRIEASVAFYTRLLGFEVADEGDLEDPGFRVLRRGRDLLFLSSHAGDGAFGQAIVVLVDDVDEIVRELRTRGLKAPEDRHSPVHEAAVDQTWGTREFYADDPDGNTIRFIEGLRTHGDNEQPREGGLETMKDPGARRMLPDTDLEDLSRERLVEEVRKLRNGIRSHRDSSGHELCWHHPDLWRLLPEDTDPLPVVPEWPEFLRGCIRYRQSLDEQLPGAPGRDRPTELGSAVPILRVESLDRSVAYYVERLGFEVEWRSDPVAAVVRDRTSLMLSEGDQGHPGTWSWIAAGNVDELYAELEARGALLRHPPTNYPWGSRECQVTDPDGHVLRFGAESQPGQPLGPWLDGSGRRWLPQPDGSWRAEE